MNPPRSAISVQQREQVIIFRVEGRATMKQSSAVWRVAEAQVTAGRDDLRFDLCSCTYMDSTFLGTLLCLCRDLKRRGAGKLTLISPSGECRYILHQMGLEALLPVLEAKEQAEGPWFLLSDDLDDLSFKRTVVQAHQELAGLPGPAGEQFRAVAEGMAAEFKPDH